MNIAAMQKLIDPIKRRVVNMIARAVVNEIDDAGKVQILSVGVLAGEEQGDIERVQNYGFTSHPLPGCEAIVVYIGGNRNHGIALAVEDRQKRLVGLPAGGVGVYTSDENKIVLEPENGVAVTTPKVAIAANDEFSLETAAVTITAETYEIGSPKLKLGTDTAELVTLFESFITAVMTAKTATSLGPQLLVSPDFADIKQKVTSLKM